jgi:hypothetical protein
MTVSFCRSGWRCDINECGIFFPGSVVLCSVIGHERSRLSRASSCLQRVEKDLSTTVRATQPCSKALSQSSVEVVVKSNGVVGVVVSIDRRSCAANEVGNSAGAIMRCRHGRL